MGVPVALDLLGIPTPILAWPHPTTKRPPVGVRLGTIAAATRVIARDIPVARAVILANDSLSDVVGAYPRKDKPPPRHRSRCTTSLPLGFLIVSTRGCDEGLDSLGGLTWQDVPKG